MHCPPGLALRNHLADGQQVGAHLESVELRLRARQAALPRQNLHGHGLRELHEAVLDLPPGGHLR
eukprot:7682119-Pyramimonas_sp.AAC.1